TIQLPGMGLKGGHKSPLLSLEYILNTIPNCLRLSWHEARRDITGVRTSPGITTNTKIAIIATTAANSHRVIGLRFMVLLHHRPRRGSHAVALPKCTARGRHPWQECSRPKSNDTGAPREES